MEELRNWASGASQDVRVATNQGHAGAVLCLVVADAAFGRPCAERPATWVFTGGGVVSLLLQPLRREESHPALRPLLLAAERSGDVLLLDPAVPNNPTPLLRYEGPTRCGVGALAAMRGRLFVGSLDGFICEFSVWAAKQRRRIPGHKGAITALLVEGDGHKNGAGAKRLVSASVDGTLRFLDVGCAASAAAPGCKRVARIGGGRGGGGGVLVHATTLARSGAEFVCPSAYKLSHLRPLLIYNNMQDSMYF